MVWWCGMRCDVVCGVLVCGVVWCVVYRNCIGGYIRQIQPYIPHFLSLSHTHTHTPEASLRDAFKITHHLFADVVDLCVAQAALEQRTSLVRTPHDRTARYTYTHVYMWMCVFIYICIFFVPLVHNPHKTGQ
jgi:hypothetical protein